MIKVLIASLVLFSSISISAQKHLIIRSDGTSYQSYEQLYSNEEKPIDLNKKTIRQYFQKHNSLTDYNTILSPFHDMIVNSPVSFMFQGQDWLVQWIEAPADMKINKIGINFNSLQNPGAQVGVKLVKINWTKQQINSAGNTSWGYYQASGNGYNDKTAFLDNPDKTGDWIDLEGSGQTPIFGNDIWSNRGEGYKVSADTSSGFENWQWLDLSTFGAGNTVRVPRGTIVGVAVQNSEQLLGEGNIWAYAAEFGQTAFKFYGGSGWWSRSFTWDFALDVTLPGSPPEINVTQLKTSLNTDERLVTAMVNQNDSTIAVNLIYYLNGGGVQDTIQMNLTGINNYEGYIPGQVPGTEVFYFVEALTNVESVIQSQTYSYKIFLPQNPSLLVFSGYYTKSGYPQSYYFGMDDFTNYITQSWKHDTWVYGSLTAELLNYYDNIIYISTNMAYSFCADSTGLSVLRSWVDAAPNHNLLIAGDEWLGSYSDWVDKTYQKGDFEYDVLGMQAFHNDINYVSYGDEFLASKVQPIQGSLLGGPLFEKHLQVLSDSNWTSSVLYNPKYEIGVKNWLDGIDFLSDVEVDLTGTAKDGVTKYSIAGHRVLPAGNKIAFFAYDPISLDSDSSEYYWYGFSASAPQVIILDWFGIAADVKQIGNDIPDKFVLSQNYPNPFNPTTIIKYSVPVVEKNNAVETRHALSVQLKVYDVLGREIRTLVNEKQSPGNYQVQFEADNLSSGVYIYRLSAASEAGVLQQSKKMILLR